MEEFKEPKYTYLLERPSTHLLPIIGVIIILAVVIGVVWFFFFNTAVHQQSVVTDVDTSQEVSAGTLLMSLTQQGQERTYTNMYTLAIGAENAVPVQVDEKFLFGLEPSNLDGPNLFFAVTTSDFSISEFPDYPVRAHQLSSDRSTAAPIVGADGLLQRSLAYNRFTDRLAFMYYNGTEEDDVVSQNVQDWNIAILSKSPDTERKIVIESAAYPQWSPNGAYLFYLGEFGLTAYDTIHEIHQVLWEVENKAEESMQIGSEIAISPDGYQLVWTTPDEAGRIDVFDILNVSKNDAAPVVKRAQVFEKPGYRYTSPVISPDNTSVALIADYGSGHEIHIISLATGEMLRTYPLDNFDSKRLFIDSWVHYDF